MAFHQQNRDGARHGGLRTRHRGEIQLGQVSQTNRYGQQVQANRPAPPGPYLVAYGEDRRRAVLRA
jgi:hypothetical protein